MLARDLKMPIRELRDKITTDEFYQWVAFYSYEHKMNEMERARAKRGG